jgi:DNA repair protein RadC
VFRRCATPIIRTGRDTFFRCPTCNTDTPLSSHGLGWTANTPAAIADRLMVAIGGEEREVLEVLLLDTKNHVIGQERVYQGHLSASHVRIAEVFTEAIRHVAASIVLCHNHPSGDLTPSPDDLHLTAEILAAGRLLGIGVLDHVIVSRDGYTSLYDRGIAFHRMAEATAPYG